MSNIIEQARVDMQRIRREVCAKLGCKMEFKGGRNAGCGDGCDCSVPVHECERCGDSDYGDTPEGLEIIRECRARRLEEAGCDCQCPEPESGAALVSQSCPVHG